MRTTNNMLVNNMLYYMNNNLNRMSKFQTQMATGKKIEIPSDDPIVAARALKFRTDVSEVGQFKSNANDAASWMEITEDTLAKLGDIIQAANERAVQAANGTLTDDDRNKIRQELIQLKSQTIQLSNTSYAGRYIFSGFMTDTKLMNEDGSYNCSVSSKETMLIKTGLLDVNAATPISFSSGNNSFNISLTGAAADYVTVSLTNGSYDTLDKVATEIQNQVRAQATARPELKGVTVSAVDNRLEIGINDTTAQNGQKLAIYLKQNGLDQVLDNLNIKTEGFPGMSNSKSEDVKYQVGIGDLISVNVPGSELFGTGFKGQTPEYIDVFNEFIDSLGNSVHTSSKGVFVNSSNPLDLTVNNQFNVTYDGVTKSIALDPVIYDGTLGKTMDDLAGNMQAKINVAFGINAVSIINRSGKLVVSGNSGKTVTLLSSASNDALVPLNFDLVSGSAVSVTWQQGISTSVKDLQRMLDKLLSVRSDTGSRMNRIELTLNRLESDNINFTKLMSDNEDVDMAEVIMNLKNEENVYRSSLAGGARIIMPTLVDFLR